MVETKGSDHSNSSNRFFSLAGEWALVTHTFFLLWLLAGEHESFTDFVARLALSLPVISDFFGWYSTAVSMPSYAVFVGSGAMFAGWWTECWNHATHSCLLFFQECKWRNYFFPLQRRFSGGRKVSDLLQKQVVPVIKACKRVLVLVFPSDNTDNTVAAGSVFKTFCPIGIWPSILLSRTYAVW